MTAPRWEMPEQTTITMIHRPEPTPETMHMIATVAEFLIRAADILLDLIIITAGVGLAMLVYDFIHNRNDQ